MARFEFRLPDLGEGVHEGEVVAWHVAVGDRVREHDPMLEVMTDKSTVAIGAPCDGIVTALHAEVGAVARAGEILVTFESASDRGASDPTPPPAPIPSTPASLQSTPVASAVGDLRESLPAAEYFAHRDPTAPVEDYFEPKPLAAPSTRGLARDLEVDLRRVRPAGPDRRVTDEDVRAHHERFGHPLPRPGGDPDDRRVPFVGLRRKIAARMQHAVTTAAHFTFVEECDVSRLVALREQLRPEAERRGLPLHFLPFVARAVALALGRHPALNAALDVETNELVYRGAVHLGIATATPSGLVVPVVRDARRLSIFELAREIERVSRLAREGRARPSELSGSTFTLTSLGKHGGLFATPVLNMPEVGILGIHQIKRKPVVRGERIEIGDVMLLSLTCDHRFVDGHVGAAFAYDVIARLEDPESLLGAAEEP